MRHVDRSRIRDELGQWQYHACLEAAGLGLVVALYTREHEGAAIPTLETRDVVTGEPMRITGRGLRGPVADFRELQAMGLRAAKVLLFHELAEQLRTEHGDRPFDPHKGEA